MLRDGRTGDTHFMFGYEAKLKIGIACCGLPTFGLARSRNTASVLNAIGLWHKEQELFKA